MDPHKLGGIGPSGLEFWWHHAVSSLIIRGDFKTPMTEEIEDSEMETVGFLVHWTSFSP